MSQPRVNISKLAPDLYKTMGQLDIQTNEALEAAGIAKGFSHLLKLRASQINGCAYCLRLHAKDAQECGETLDRISVLSSWKETGYFTDKERSALALMEAITLIADGQIEDAIYDEAKKELTDAQIVAIQWLGVTINAWNRIGISSRYIVKP